MLGGSSSIQDRFTWPVLNGLLAALAKLDDLYAVRLRWMMTIFRGFPSRGHEKDCKGKSSSSSEIVTRGHSRAGWVRSSSGGWDGRDCSPRSYQTVDAYPRYQTAYCVGDIFPNPRCTVLLLDASSHTSQTSLIPHIYILGSCMWLEPGTRARPRMCKPPDMASNGESRCLGALLEL